MYSYYRPPPEEIHRGKHAYHIQHYSFCCHTALTEFEGLCGFRPYDEVATYLERIPELKTVVGVEESSSFISACKSKFCCANY